MKGARLTAALARSVNFLLAASTALVLWYGARLVIDGELSPGELLVFLTYLRNTYRPVPEAEVARDVAGREVILAVHGFNVSRGHGAGSLAAFMT